LKKGLNRINMEIKIKKIDCHQVDGSASDMISTYNVMQNNREFRITCRSNIFGRSFSLDGMDGTLYTNREDNMVHVQKVALGGGCGLIIDDETIEGLSPLTIRAIILAEQNTETREITITIKRLEDGACHPVLLIDGTRKNIYCFSDIFPDIEGLR